MTFKYQLLIIFSLFTFMSAAGKRTVDYPAEAADFDEHMVEAGMAIDAPRACTSDAQCNPGACNCSEGHCRPNGFGPPPPAGYCELPPERTCTATSNCSAGCFCSDGVCEPDGRSPSNPICHLPPPDEYESDDTYSSASHYMDAPQIHTFSHAGDADWVRVHFGTAGTAVFETESLVHFADTYVEVYRWQDNALGPRLAADDDVCGVSHYAQCKRSRVTLNVPADSAYYMRISSRSGSSLWNEYRDNDPTYTVRISYQ